MCFLSIDPSGNYQEGKGTTGFALFHNGVPGVIHAEKATGYPSQEEYWQGVLKYIASQKPTDIVMESYQLYNHKGQRAEKQSNSFLETPQLIGLIRFWCWQKKIPLFFQSAAQAKGRYPDGETGLERLCREGFLYKQGNFHYAAGQRTNKHIQDAIRHGAFYHKFKREGFLNGKKQGA